MKTYAYAVIMRRYIVRFLYGMSTWLSQLTLVSSQYCPMVWPMALLQMQTCWVVDTAKMRFHHVGTVGHSYNASSHSFIGWLLLNKSPRVGLRNYNCVAKANNANNPAS